MLGFGKNKAVKAWQDWIAQRDAQREELSSVKGRLRQLEKDRSRAKKNAFWEAHPVLELTDFPVKNKPLSEFPSPQEVVAKVEWGLQQQESQRDRGQGISWNLNEVRSALSKLKPLVEEAERLDAEWNQLLDQQARLQEAVDSLESNPPKAGHGALEAFDNEIQSAEEAISRVDRTLEGMSDGDSLVAHAKEEAQRAQARLDDLEATAALGEANEEDQRTAAATLKRAHAEVEQAKAEASRLESARRGLERKRHQLIERRDDLGTKHAEIAGEVYLEDLASAEQRLVEALGSDEIRELVEEVNAGRRQLNQAVNHGESTSPTNSPFRPLSVAIEFDALKHHSESKQLNRVGIKV